MRKSTPVLTFTAFWFLATVAGHCQILNPGFENWTAGEPDAWFTSNSEPTFINVTRTTDAHSGSFALRGEVVQPQGSKPPSVENDGVGQAGSGIAQRFVSLDGWIKFHSESSDLLEIFFIAYSGGTPVGNGSLNATTELTEWTGFSIPAEYLSGSVAPDTVYIKIRITGEQGTDPHTGSWFELDDLALENENAVQHSRESTKNVLIWPNPVNGSARASVSLSEPGIVGARIVDVTGRTLRQMQLGWQPCGPITIPLECNGIPCGRYQFIVNSGDRTLVTPLIVIGNE